MGTPQTTAQPTEPQAPSPISQVLDWLEQNSDELSDAADGLAGIAAALQLSASVDENHMANP